MGHDVSELSLEYLTVELQAAGVPLGAEAKGGIGPNEAGRYVDEDSRVSQKHYTSIYSLYIIIYIVTNGFFFV